MEESYSQGGRAGTIAVGLADAEASKRGAVLDFNLDVEAVLWACRCLGVIVSDLLARGGDSIAAVVVGF